MAERKSWSEYQDSVLKLLREEKDVKKWSQISKQMKKFGIPNRNGKQCRQRYQNHLKEGITKTPWTEEEESKFLALHLEHGNRWTFISHQLKIYGNFRTGNITKNYFTSLMKHSIKTLNRVIKAFKNYSIRPVPVVYLSKFMRTCEEIRCLDLVDRVDKLTLCKEIQENLLFFGKQGDDIDTNRPQLLKKVLEITNEIKLLKKLCNKKKINKEDKKYSNLDSPISMVIKNENDFSDPLKNSGQGLTRVVSRVYSTEESQKYKIEEEIQKHENNPQGEEDQNKISEEQNEVFMEEFSESINSYSKGASFLDIGQFFQRHL